MSNVRFSDQSLVWPAMIGTAAGLGLMYLLDPVSGRRRRARVLEGAVHAQHELEDAATATAKDLAHRSKGLVASVAQHLGPDSADDSVILARVRSALGFVCSHPGAIDVQVHEGRVWLSGTILASELRRVMSQVRRVRGVREVRQDLRVHASPEGVPDLQGGSPRIGHRFELLQSNWAPGVRFAAGLTGAALVVRALREREPTSAVVALAGSALLLRAWVNEPLRQATGLDPEHQTIRITKTAHIDAPVNEVFELFGRAMLFPLFMRHVLKVEKKAHERWRWVVRGPLGMPVTWDAAITEMVPNQRVAWKSLPGPAVRHSGVVHFETMPEGKTRVQIELEYTPPGGVLGHLFAKVTRGDPKHAMDEDLLRLKSLIETGKATGKHRTVTWEELVGAPPA